MEFFTQPLLDGVARPVGLNMIILDYFQPVFSLVLVMQGYEWSVWKKTWETEAAVVEQHFLGLFLGISSVVLALND